MRPHGKQWDDMCASERFELSPVIADKKDKKLIGSSRTRTDNGDVDGPGMPAECCGLA